MAEVVRLFVDNEEVASVSETLYDVRDPATGALVCRVPEATPEEVGMVLEAAARAFPKWKATSVVKRQAVLFRIAEGIRRESESLAATIVQEMGKTIADARGDVLRGLQVAEYACGYPSVAMGEVAHDVAAHMDTASMRVPLGVCVGICPFNFPAMVPLWMFPLMVAAGNAAVIKPSERCPGAMMALARIAAAAGLPPGVLSVVHGGRAVVEALCVAPEVMAVSFVGSDAAGRAVHALAAAHGKRVQANLGAKNHAVVLPDAPLAQTADAIVGAAFGAAGQRCMALSALVLVAPPGDAAAAFGRWTHELRARAAALVVGRGADGRTDVGPLVSPAAASRVRAIVQGALDDGATLVLDGRTPELAAGLDPACFVGPTILAGVSPDMRAYREEIFGPVLVVLPPVATLADAIALVNKCPYGNGASVFTASGAAARAFADGVGAGMVGVNVPVPVPLPFFSFTGARASMLGDLHHYGREGILFYTSAKTVTSLWRPDFDGEGQEESSRPVTHMV